MTNDNQYDNPLEEVSKQEPTQLPPVWLPKNASEIDVGSHMLNIDQEVKLPPYLFEWKGVKFGPVGSIMALTGKKKSGKTMASTLLMSALMNGECDGLKSLAQEVLGRAPRILWIDTEQEEAFTLMCQRRVFYKSRLDYRTPQLNLQILRLSDVQSTNERWIISKVAIERFKPDFILLDGIRDVIDDFNDAKASNDLIREVMKIATDMNALMICALHYNEGTDKMRGHLGTELGNRVSGILECEKHDDNEDDIWYKINFRDMRGKPVKHIKYRIDDSKMIFGIPVIQSDEESAKMEQDERSMLVDFFYGLNIPQSGNTWKTLDGKMNDAGCTSKRTREDRLKKAIEYNIISKRGNLYYYLNGLYVPPTTQEPQKIPDNDKVDNDEEDPF